MEKENHGGGGGGGGGQAPPCHTLAPTLRIGLCYLGIETEQLHYQLKVNNVNEAVFNTAAAIMPDDMQLL